MNYVHSTDNKLEFTDFIIKDENISAGGGTVDFSRLNLDDAGFEALSLDESRRPFYVVNKHLLDERNKIIFIISVKNNDMPANSEIDIILYNKLAGQIETITKTLIGVLAGEKLVYVIEDSELEEADYFTLDFRFEQDAVNPYDVDVELRVKKKIVESGGASTFEDDTQIAGAGQTVFSSGTGFNINHVYVDNVLQMPDQYINQGTPTITFLVAPGLNALVYLTT